MVAPSTRVLSGLQKHLMKFSQLYDSLEVWPLIQQYYGGPAHMFYRYISSLDIEENATFNLSLIQGRRQFKNNYSSLFYIFEYS